MKIITWNCAGKFREDYQKALDLAPDILIVQECEDIEKLGLLAWEKYPSSYFQVGDGKKNVALFTFGKLKAKLLDCHNEDFKYVIPFELSEGDKNFTLFAVWTKKTAERNYVKQAYDALLFYKENHPKLLDNCILAGDFNSNNVFNVKYPKLNHANLLAEFDSLKITSCYHKFFNEIDGQESTPSFYLQRNIAKPFHLDYCFASENFTSKLKSVKFGKADDYITHSDHLPLTVEFED